jgi:hypothetical protein
MLHSRFVLPSLVLAACGGGATIVDPPPPPSSDFVLTFRPDAEDQASAQALGWGTVIPDADVTLTPKDPLVGGPQTHRTTAAGTVTIARLTAGDYVVEAMRWLSAAERDRLTAGDDAIGFVAKAYVRAAVGGGQATVSVPASRRRSLVISEFANNELNLIPDAYQDNSYVELYNNSDTTVYVDGMLLLRAFSLSYDVPTFPCSLYQGLVFDPEGVWARWFAKFPGSGGEYPVAAGGTIVVATDAIDHSTIVPGGVDLRSAQFEMIGSADVDNPAVPNMIDISEGGSATFSGHGINWQGLNSSLTVLVMPTATAILPRTQLPGSQGAVVVRFPRNRILDTRSLHGTYAAAYPPCTSSVHPNFDRAMATLFLGYEFESSSQRRTALVLPNGRKILQHTRSSDADLVAAPRSPGVIP